jgi:hypothetical protein
MRHRQLPTRRSRRNSLQAMYEEKDNNDHLSDATTQVCSRQTRDLMIYPVIQLLLQKKLKSPNHILPRNHLKSTYISYKTHFPWLTIGILKGRLKRLYKIYKEKNPSLLPTSSNHIPRDNASKAPPTKANNTRIPRDNTGEGPVIFYGDYQEYC